MSEKKALDLMAAGDKKMAAWSWFTPGKFEQAAEAYTQAGNAMKVSKNWSGAGAAFSKAADAQLKGSMQYEAAQSYLNAAQALRKIDSVRALEAFARGVEIYTDMGRFTMAAKAEKEAAEMLEAEGNLDASLAHFAQAADLYEGENQGSAASQCLQKVALYAAQLEDYPRAIEVYEKVARHAVSNNLLRWNAKDYFFRASLCHLAGGDLVGAKRAMERYQDMDMNFAKEREFRLLQAIVAAHEAYDAEAFTVALKEYDSVSRLDEWKATILLRIKNAIKEQDDDIS